LIHVSVRGSINREGSLTLNFADQAHRTEAL